MSPSSDLSAVERWHHRSRSTIYRLRRPISRAAQTWRGGEMPHYYFFVKKRTIKRKKRRHDRCRVATAQLENRPNVEGSSPIVV